MDLPPTLERMVVMIAVMNLFCLTFGFVVGTSLGQVAPPVQAPSDTGDWLYFAGWLLSLIAGIFGGKKWGQVKERKGK